MTVASDQSCRADYSQRSPTVIQLLASIQTELLQAAQADIRADDRDHFAFFDQWKSKGGHQQWLARRVVEIRIQHAGPERLLWAAIPGVERSSIQHWRRIRNDFLGHSHVTVHRILLTPVRRKSPFFITSRD
ncbi:hypothetical protein D3C73_918940 [compost metagenome]